MYVFPETIIEWRGTEYNCRATFDIITSIENTVSLGRLISRVAQSDIPLSHLAVVLCALLKGAGCQVSKMDIHGELHSLGEEDAGALQVAAVNALAGCFPTNAPQGKKKAEP